MRPLSIAPKDRIVLAMDFSDIDLARRTADQLADHVGMYKFGLEFIYAAMSSILADDEEYAFDALRSLRGLFKGVNVKRTFLDGKLDDIPTTVGKASLAISNMGMQWFNVHASAGMESIKAAVANRGHSKVFGVTVLTTTTSEECVSIFGVEPNQKVARFALNLFNAGADGIICSPKELKLLRADETFNQMMIATPGVRPLWAAANDQKRIMTPGEAIVAGADYLVIGRPITAAADPVEAAQKIAEEIRLAEYVAK